MSALHQRMITPWRPLSIQSPGVRGTIVEAAGRGLRKNGLPLASVLSARDQSDVVSTWRLAAPPSEDAWDYEPILTAVRTDFTRCPICHSTRDLTSEHVPPARLGGQVLTSTCRTCNNAFGKYEDVLLRATEERYTLAVRGPSFVGERKVADVIVRSNEAGERLITTWNGVWPSWFDAVFEGDEHEYRFEASCSCGAYAAAVKSAYLAACVLAPTIVTEPERWPVADQMRRCLQNWRDADGHLAQPSHFQFLQVRYKAAHSDTPAVVLCEATNRESGEHRQVLRLGWQLVVDWPVDAASVVVAAPGRGAVVPQV